MPDLPSAQLVARKGQKNKHHFGHYGSPDERPCAAGPETALHKFAKEVLARRRELVLPKLELQDEHDRWEGYPGGRFGFNSAFLEQRIQDIVPDVIVRKDNHDLLIEFVVTHECGPAKIAKLNELNLSAIEIDLSKLPRDTSSKGLEKAILVDAPRRWLHNVKFREGRTHLARQRRDREIKFADRVSSLRNSYLSEHNKISSAKPSFRSSNKLDELGLSLGVGINVPGAGCFLVPPYEWQAAILLNAAKAAFRGYTPFISSEHTIQFMEKRGWINRQFCRITPAEGVAICADGTPFCDPESAIKVWATELVRLGVLTPTKNGRGWVALNNALQTAKETSKRPRRASKRMNAVANCLCAAWQRFKSCHERAHVHDPSAKGRT